MNRAESSQTIATLWKSATGFNLPIFLFIEPVAADDCALLRETLLLGYSPAGNGMQVVSLFPFDAELCFEMLVIELVPEALSESAAHEKGVTEYVIVQEGALGFVVDGQLQRLGRGGKRLRDPQKI